MAAKDSKEATKRPDAPVRTDSRVRRLLRVEMCHGRERMNAQTPEPQAAVDTDKTESRITISENLSGPKISQDESCDDHQKFVSSHPKSQTESQLKSTLTASQSSQFITASIPENSHPPNDQVDLKSPALPIIQRFRVSVRFAESQQSTFGKHIKTSTHTQSSTSLLNRPTRITKTNRL